jgi:hypothetical protein
MELDIISVNFAQMLYLKTEGTAPTGSWTITHTSLVIRSIGVRVSGAGAWARLQGTVMLNIKRLENSATYQQMQKEQCISSGIRGFWNWLTEGVNASFFNQQLLEIFNELYREQKLEFKVEFDFQVTGTHPNIPREVSPSIQVLNVRMADGDSFLIMSSESPYIDSGAVDIRDKTKVPTRNNNTRIISVSYED